MGGFAVLLGTLGALSLTVTKIVDFARNAFDKEDTFPYWTWNVVALAVGLAFALGWQLNLAGQAAALVPALAGTGRLDGIAGQVLTGLLIGGGSGFFHELLDALSGVAAKNRAT
jgi:hypothetical protein